MSSLPVVDIGGIGLCVEEDELREEDVRRTASQLMDAFTTMGFVYITHHGIQQHEIDKFHEAGKEFFALPTDVKEKYHHSVECGYIRMEEEVLVPGRPGDLKECFNVQLVDEDIWPKEVEGFQRVSCNFFRTCRKLALRLMKAIAAGMGLQDLDFLSKCHGGDQKTNGTMLRMLHYPPIPPDVKKDQTRLGEHTDYGSITLLFQGSVGGLQVLSQSGEWLEAPPMPGAILVNIADLLQHWSGNILRSTLHRVKIPQEEVNRHRSRYSVAYFVHPERNTIITPLDGSDAFNPIKAGDYQRERLRSTHY